MPPQNLEQAIRLIDEGLSHNMELVAREWGEDALWLLKKGDLAKGINALSEALYHCGHPSAIRHFEQALNLLAPGRIY